jgi:hypothetical protein
LCEGRPLRNHCETPSELNCLGFNSTLDASGPPPLKIPMWFHTNYPLLPPLGPLKVSKQIPGVRCHLRPQLRAPSHVLALSTLALHSLGHMQIHIATTAPTSLATAMPSPLLLQPLSPEHHPATIQPTGLQRCATGGPGTAERHRGTMGKGLVGDRHCHFEVERVYSPS